MFYNYRRGNVRISGAGFETDEPRHAEAMDIDPAECPQKRKRRKWLQKATQVMIYDGKRGGLFFLFFI